ncbi:MAG: sugar phosphate isomerase/epimerase [Chloroflexi bacterium]|nr:sugar phosphate isomerase/epimerase [Chloroflexota bacterium]MYK60376.1 sugar phosphate isomerase/epimerase [Chloroflexota bacterium]
MLLGVAGFVKGDWLNVKPEDVKKVADHGFVSALLSIPDPSAGSDKDIANIKSLYASNGLIMPMTRGGYGGGLCSDDEDQRAWTVNFLEDTIRLSAKMGCPTTYFRPGSLNPDGAWLPHRENRSDATFDRLVKSAKQACAVADSEGIKLVVESGVVCPLYTPQRVRDFFDAVDMPALGYNMDPVNLVGSLDIAYDTTSLIDECIDLMSPEIVGCDAKDFTIVDALLPHFEEEVIGAPNAMLDNVTLLRRLQEVAPDIVVTVEHYPDEKIPAAAAGIRKASKIAGVVWD